MDSSDEDGLSTDAVHVDAGASLNIVEVYVAKLGDEVDHIILGTHLEQREGGREEGVREKRGERERGEGERRGREERERERGRGRVEGGGEGGEENDRKRGREEGKRKEREKIEENEMKGEKRI